jgi:hypothetical protein
VVLADEQSTPAEDREEADGVRPAALGALGVDALVTGT